MATGTATDGSGITMTVTSTPSASVTLRNGEKIAPVLTTGGSSSSGGPQTDSNGNQITSTINGSVTSYFDTLSSTTAALTIDTTNAASVLYKYTSAANTTANVTASYITYNVQTAFGCGISEYGPIQNSLVDRITLPDNSYYQFTYEVTPGDAHTPHYVTGRIASVRIPTGGTITYTYQGGDTGQGIFCADGSTAGFDRTTPDGTWQYRRTGTSPNYTTTITTPIDPNTGQTNTTVINFQGEFETQRQIYHGHAVGERDHLLQRNSCKSLSRHGCCNSVLANYRSALVERWFPEPRGYTIQWIRAGYRKRRIQFWRNYACPENLRLIWELQCGYRYLYGPEQ